eukprot:7389064-Prymnesium_polylepis.2
MGALSTSATESSPRCITRSSDRSSPAWRDAERMAFHMPVRSTRVPVGRGCSGAGPAPPPDSYAANSLSSRSSHAALIVGACLVSTLSVRVGGRGAAEGLHPWFGQSVYVQMVP